MVTKIGIAGLSQGNGHPFSFSAIINGYDDAGMAASGWPVVHDYLRRRDASEFGFTDVQVTHAWTQDAALTEQLCAASRIPHAATQLEDLLGEVDAVILARDDWENHFPMAQPFLQAGLPVFIDKPLSLSLEELKFFRPFLESGQLMSCAGMRYARELDEVRVGFAEYGAIKLIRGAIVVDWPKYGVHLVDAVYNLTAARALSIVANECGHDSFAIAMSDGSLLQIDALGGVPKTFGVDVWGERQKSTHEIADNFSMFRRTLWHFVNSIREKRPAIPAQLTLDVMRLLIAGRIAQQEKRKVFLDEIVF